MTIDWFVLLTPLLLLPIFLLFVFVGCAEILGIEDGVLRPETQDGTVRFTYAAGLPGAPPQGQDVRRIAWTFDTSDLQFPEGEDVPMGFNPGIHERGQPSSTPILPAGETVEHGSIGAPESGTLSCECRLFLGDDVAASLIQTVSKSPGDVDFPHFELSQDLVLT